jgi:ribosomal protein S16
LSYGIIQIDEKLDNLYKKLYNMVKKNYVHNVIRLRKGKPSVSQVYWIIVILNKKKTSSQKQVEQLGFFRHGKKRLFSLDYKRLAYFLNKGYKLKKSIKKYIYWYSLLYCKYFFLNKKKLKKLNLKNCYKYI